MIGAIQAYKSEFQCVCYSANRSQHNVLRIEHRPILLALQIREPSATLFFLQ